MKVYVVTRDDARDYVNDGTPSDFCVMGVFSTELAAEKHLEKFKVLPDVEYEITEETIDTPRDL